MSISDRDRKLLWARAGGTCTLCKKHLTEGAKGDDKDVVLGEEAHIVSEKPKGPRFRPMPQTEVDSYANLLLLCLPDHKIVDEQVTHYTEQRLQTLNGASGKYDILIGRRKAGKQGERQDGTTIAGTERRRAEDD